MPMHNFDDFVLCCQTKSQNVFVLKQPLSDANEYFQLRTKTILLEFIGNNGLENLTFECTKEWRLNPAKNDVLHVDSYEFRSGGKRGYIAIIFNKKNETWTIKSFHLSKNSNPAMAIAFKKAITQKGGEKYE